MTRARMDEIERRARKEFARVSRWPMFDELRAKMARLMRKDERLDLAEAYVKARYDVTVKPSKRVH